MEIEKIKGIGPKTAAILHEHNIYTTLDLLHYIPRKYNCYEIKDVDPFSGEKTCVLATILSGVVSGRIRYTNCIFFSALINHKNTKILIFGQEFLRYKLKKGINVILSGYYKHESKTFFVQRLFFDVFSCKIEPDYRFKEIANSTMQKCVGLAMSDIEEYKETLPIELCKKYRLYEDKEYFYNAHFPKTKETLHQVERRKKYEEFFWYSLSLEALNYQKKKLQKIQKRIDLKELEQVAKTLPFSLTDEQNKVLKEVLADLESSNVMNRLIQGDVGSGKTIVSLLAAYAAVKAGYQVAIMAPTEVLALQHYYNTKKFFPDINTNILTSQTKKAQREKIRKELQTGENKILIGTHALLQSDVVFNNLGLVVIDEQQRFGVVQRAKLLTKSKNIDALYLTATPIPRTLGFAEFGDLDISSIRSKPKGDRNIDTIVLSFEQMNELYISVDKEIKKGHQAYIIAPLIEEGEEEIGFDVYQTKELLEAQFPTYNVAALHGKLKSSVKSEVLEAFKNKEIDILVSTTVIEVGIDIENATIMAILNANRFGLSQLHQLRGRVGRNDFQNYCYLISSKIDCPRLEILSKTQDGFELSNEDLKLRGPGDFFGEDQSGYINMQFADVVLDHKIWECAKTDAKVYFQDYLQNNTKNDEFAKIISKVTQANTIIH